MTPYIDFSLNGLTVKEAIAATKEYVRTHNLGRVKVNYRLRDAIFSRQRYWGEPFPVYYKDGIPCMIPEECLPIQLPQVENFLPTETGEPPLGHAQIWAWDEDNRTIVDKALIDNKHVFPLELNTMPGFAGSSAYYLRYMDPHNNEALVDPDIDRYWRNVDLYIGGTEHATGHLIYSRFWNKFLHDYGYSCTEEPFQKLINQGMIQGWSSFVYRVSGTNTFVSFDLLDSETSDDGKTVRYTYKGTEANALHADISFINGNQLDVEGFRGWQPQFGDAEYILNPAGQFIVSQSVEKMSKSKYNVVNPDDICQRYGADTLRLYEMFLGPIEQSKPWGVAGIDGCFRFLKKLWGLYYDRDGAFTPCDDEPSRESLKSLHKLIQKVTQDIEAFSYNTAISAFMICVGELAKQKCISRAVLEPLVSLLAPFAPHMAEELWEALGHQTTVCDSEWPELNAEYLKEDTETLSVSFNGKTRFTLDFAPDATPAAIQQAVLAEPLTAIYTDGKQIVKIIVVPRRIINIVVK